MSYSRATIYYFSGTGNSYRVSSWMEETAKQNGLEAGIASIDRAGSTSTIDKDADLIGLVAPTHGFTSPWHMLKFATRMPRGKSRHAFCASTRAGLKWGPAFIPGISGSANFIITLILALKGYKVRGAVSIDMPSNWYSLHPIQKLKKQRAIIERAEPKTIDFMNKIISGRREWFTVNNLYELLWGIILSYISLLYLVIGRFFLAKLFFANSGCNGCGLCADSCPVEAIVMHGRRKTRPFWKYNCESCMRCAALCPQKAVEAGHSWGVLLYFISSVPASVIIFSSLGSFFPGLAQTNHAWLSNIIKLLYLYSALFLSYYVFDKLLLFPSINWFFTHTTMTHFWGRYHEPDLNRRNLMFTDKEKK